MWRSPQYVLHGVVGYAGLVDGQTIGYQVAPQKDSSLPEFTWVWLSF